MIDFVDRHLEDYTNFDRAEDFEDRASSIRWCIAQGATFRLWQDKDACGGNHADFVGSGQFHVDSDLDDFGDAASCAEWDGGPFARAGRDRTAECTGATTSVQLNGSASISLPGEPLTFSWQAAGVTFDDPGSATPVGNFPRTQTTVTLTVSDSAGSDSDTVNVAVVDRIAPTITCPNVVVDATMPSGAVVSYPGPTAADSCSVRSIACAAPSGSTFQIGTNTVQCTVTDGGNNAATCGFTVKVTSPAEQAAALIEKIKALAGVKDAMKNSLIAKVEAALMSIASGNTAAACWDLLALLQAVQAQSGKQLTSTQAADLIADITRIRAALGCS